MSIIHPAVLLLLAAAQAGEIEFAASVDRTTLRADERLTLTIEVSGDDVRSFPDVDLPRLHEFAIVAGPSRSSNFQWINGRMTSSKSYSWVLAPLDTGRLTIGSATIEYEGRRYQTEPISVSVSPGGRLGKGPPPLARGQAPGDEDLFLSARPDRTTLYLGEQLMLSYNLYTTVSVRNYTLKNLPNAVGFLMEELQSPSNPVLRDVVINGKRYRTAMIRQVALFPTQSGELTIDPLTLVCDVELPSRRRGWLFDDFFSDPFFGRRATREITSQPVTVTVLPLPSAGKPQGFSGAVGRYTIRAWVDASEVKANEALTYSVRIEGRGNMRAVTLPDVDFPPEADVFDPETSERLRTTRGARGGFREYRFVLIPRREGMITLEPVRFSYFDPKEEKYRTVASKAITLQVARGEESGVTSASGLSKEEIALLSSDIRFIKGEDYSLRRIGSHFYTSRWLVVWGASPLFALFCAIWYRRYEERMSTNVAYSRRRRASSVARRRLKEALKEMGDDEAAAFWSTLAKAVTGYVSDRLNLPESAASPEEIVERLEERGIPTEVIGRCGEFLAMCDLHRFSPGGEAGGDRVAAHGEASELIELLGEHA